MSTLSCVNISMHNALGAIDKLYFENTEEGHNALIKFSNYLRGNMDSLAQKNGYLSRKNLRT